MEHLCFNMEEIFLSLNKDIGKETGGYNRYIQFKIFLIYFQEYRSDWRRYALFPLVFFFQRIQILAT